MKVLTATNRTQGWRDNDFCWTVQGELVVFPPVECARGSVDDCCGCRRSMAGLASHLATTTIEVVDRAELDPETYFKLISDSLRDQGYVMEEPIEDPEANEWLRSTTNELMLVASAFPGGTVLERRGDVISVRRT